MSGKDASQECDNSRLVVVIAVDLLKEDGTCHIESQMGMIVPQRKSA
eukprot:CAMPEP_0185036632 /NCGR_PEP_ID=MMETSP1103-20130426/29847_1 /TAXON_ID=36769 /ORGANISM="Paraphysomonas bandaiensis, Strain Caron Lab Isolate" /LENGTH=46 /DNA_ID= /DNA_START= /DNA_END= /DNA_ORIENTATION=